MCKEFSSLAMAAHELTRSGSRAQQQQAAQILAETRRNLYGLLASDADDDDDQDLVRTRDWDRPRRDVGHLVGTVWPMRRSLRRWGQPLIAAPFIGSAAWATWNGLVAYDVSSAVETACDSARLYALPWPDVPDLGLSASPVCGCVTRLRRDRFICVVRGYARAGCLMCLTSSVASAVGGRRRGH